jgi:integrase/recombinase XerD
MTKILGRDPARRCLKIAEWPEADRRLWLSALQPGDVLEAGGARSGYRPASNRNAASGYGRWLAWLECCGRLDQEQAPALRITRDAVAAYVQTLIPINSPVSIRVRLEALYQAARVMGANLDWQWLRRLRSGIRDDGQSKRDKRGRLVSSADLCDLGLRLMEQPVGRRTAREHAICFRDGLAIALLAARPLRRENFAGLRLDRHLAKRGEIWWIYICGEETKTATPIEMPWPEGLVTHLQTWLLVHRPCLAARRGRWNSPLQGALWVSSHGSPMTGMALYDRISLHTRAAFGKPINPHLFRDCAATSLAIEDPAHIRMAATILGHRTLATTERHYNLARSLEAARQWQDVIGDLRGETD